MGGVSNKIEEGTKKVFKESGKVLKDTFAWSIKPIGEALDLLKDRSASSDETGETDPDVSE